MRRCAKKTTKAGAIQQIDDVFGLVDSEVSDVSRWLRLRQWWCVLEEEDEAEVEEEEEI